MAEIIVCNPAAISDEGQHSPMYMAVLRADFSRARSYNLASIVIHLRVTKSFVVDVEQTVFNRQLHTSSSFSLGNGISLTFCSMIFRCLYL